jgi:hypothetical protein
MYASHCARNKTYSMLSGHDTIRFGLQRPPPRRAAARVEAVSLRTMDGQNDMSISKDIVLYACVRYKYHITMGVLLPVLMRLSLVAWWQIYC